MKKKEVDRIQAHIILFNTVDSIENYDDFFEKNHAYTSIRFIDEIEKKFSDVKQEWKHITVKDKGKDFHIYIYDDKELTTHKNAEVYGEEGLLKMIELAKEKKMANF